MSVLHNRISQAELKKLLYAETERRTTISFYQYFAIEDPKQFRDELYKALNAIKVFGRIYIAHEGINAQISVPETNFEARKNYRYSIAPLNGLRLNIAVDDDGKSFWVLKIKVRQLNYLFRTLEFKKLIFTYLYKISIDGSFVLPRYDAP